MVIAGNVLDAPTRMIHYFELIEHVNGVSAIVEVVQKYLASWSNDRITSLQKIDGGWAPFDEGQQPLQVHSVAAVQCTRDAIHRHCIALREAGMALSPELVELDEFFYTAGKLLDECAEAMRQRRAQERRTPATPTHRDVFANW